MLGAPRLDLFYHELQCLVTAWTLEVLCIYVISWLFWQGVVIWDILLLLASWLCHWYDLIYFLRVIVDMVIHNLCWKQHQSGVSFTLIMQIRVQNKRKSVRKSRYVGDVSTPPSLNLCLSLSNSVDKLKVKKKLLRTLLLLFP